LSISTTASFPHQHQRAIKEIKKQLTLKFFDGRVWKAKPRFIIWRNAQYTASRKNKHSSLTMKHKFLL